MEFYQKTGEAILAQLNSCTSGLTQEQAKKRLALYGANHLEEGKRPPIWRLFLDAFLDPMMFILTILVVIQLFLGEWVEALVILSVLLLNAFISVLQTCKAENSLDALREIAAPYSIVKRAGLVASIPAKELVVGDIILLEAGDLVPADGRILSLSGLKVDESILTGEALPVLKEAAPLSGTQSLGDRTNMVFSGTIVVHGRAEVVITATGSQAEMGKIAALLEHAQRRQTPLQQKLAHFSKRLGALIFALCALVFLVQTVRILESGGDIQRGLFDALMFSIAVAVAAVPEALSSIITIVLARGTKQMAKEHAIVRKLPAVESLGSATVICTDKTGTLTQNKMTVQDYFPKVHTNTSNTLLIDAAMLCNDAQFDRDNKVLGDPTETALLTWANTQHADTSKYIRIVDLPFDSTRKRMSVLCKSEGQSTLFVKGAPDVLFSLCTQVMHENKSLPFDCTEQERFAKQNEYFSKKGYRVLAFASKELSAENHALSTEDESNLTLLGLIAMSDPPRKEVYAAIEKAKAAGIQTVMITGDHKTTAHAIACDIGLADEHSLTLSGAELDALAECELLECLPNIAVFARVSPEHKIRIVESFQKLGHIVAMTGDGVNDAPSLKQADIGIAMGSGTSVSKDASAMILTDDNFASIISAVSIGRTIFDNIKKSIGYLFSGNLAAIIAILFALALGWDKPFTALQLLFINLMNDSLPAIALGLEAPEENILERKPRNKDEGIFGGGLLEDIVVRGMIMAVFTILAQFLGTVYFSAQIGGAMAFSALLLCRTFQTFSARSNSKNLLKLGLLSNKYVFFAVLVCLFFYTLVLLPSIRTLFYLPHYFSLWHIAITLFFSLGALFLMEIFPFLRKMLTPKQRVK